MSYVILFITALGAATLLPGGSEALLLYYKAEGLNPLMLLITASIGNTLGSVVNYILGKYACTWAINKNYIRALHVKKAQTYFDRYGAFALLLSWTPIIGDPITFVAGVLRYNFWKFLTLVLISKTARYALLLYLYTLYF
jgi:membrane protein YqaA with SNARE-associated domain